ncbi:MAG: hypothetical protein M1823_003078 [Watsoniomyces obsoletus]|nr:MAG: hypothetical protein M1823_003078 [Watsoniomyces obsoletus]
MAHSSNFSASQHSTRAIPRGSRRVSMPLLDRCPSPSKARCSYTQHQCAFRSRTDDALIAAGEFGQTLLRRHESYVAEAEREKCQMEEKIKALEMEKHQLEMRNAKSIRDNRQLLEHIEDINTIITDSDAKITALTAQLESTEQELLRVSRVARRAEDLEEQLQDLELAHGRLQDDITTAQQQEQTATRRFKKAERAADLLREDLEQLELEVQAKAEREAAAPQTKPRAIPNRSRTPLARAESMPNDAWRLTVRRQREERLQADEQRRRDMSGAVLRLWQDNKALQQTIAGLQARLQQSDETMEELREQLQQSEEMAFEERSSRRRSLADELCLVEDHGAALAESVFGETETEAGIETIPVTTSPTMNLVLAPVAPTTGVTNAQVHAPMWHLYGGGAFARQLLQAQAQAHAQAQRRRPGGAPDARPTTTEVSINFILRGMWGACALALLGLPTPAEPAPSARRGRREGRRGGGGGRRRRAIPGGDAQPAPAPAPPARRRAGSDLTVEVRTSRVMMEELRDALRE